MNKLFVIFGLISLTFVLLDAKKRVKTTTPENQSEDDFFTSKPDDDDDLKGPDVKKSALEKRYGRYRFPLENYINQNSKDDHFYFISKFKSGYYVKYKEGSEFIAFTFTKTDCKKSDVLHKKDLNFNCSFKSIKNVDCVLRETNHPPPLVKIEGLNCNGVLI